MYPQSFSFGTDPNVNRMIEETVAILNDVDQRLQALKIGIVQSVPHLAPQILARDPLLASRLGISTPFAPHLGAFPTPFSGVGLPGLSSPIGTPFPSPLLGVGSTPWAGVSSVAGFPGAGFRLF